MISIVNGYMCKDGTEAAQAMQGKDPSAPRGSPPYSSGTDNKIPQPVNLPATIVDSALQVLLGAKSITPPVATTGVKPFGTVTDQKLASVTGAKGEGDTPPDVETADTQTSKARSSKTSTVDRMA
jgi:hypothetical protein